MTMRPLGPAAMMAKLQELRAQFEPPQTKSVEKFQMPSQPSPLAGEITSDGTKPFDPFGGNVHIGTSLPQEMIRPLIQRAASRNGIDENLLEALVQAESNFDPSAVSKRRAVGLTQLMPDTAKELGVTDPFDPVQNLNGGAKYLARMLNQFQGDIPTALAAYNAGPGAVRKHGGIPPFSETRNYVEKIMRNYTSRIGR